MFASRVREVLEGESVRKCEKKIDGISGEIADLKKKLERRPPRLAVWEEKVHKLKGLEGEKEQIVMRLEEFKAAMQCILARFDGAKVEREKFQASVDVFEFGGELDWGRIHHLMARECRRLDESLPIYAYRRKILHHILFNQVTVLVGETGSGKSTQLVQFLADSWPATGGSIVCTQPRKIAALSLAERVQEESSGCYEANSVVCHPTYSSAQELSSKVVFMTDHCLLQHFMHDVDSVRISYVIVDEAHERSLNTDLLLAQLKKLLLERIDLRLIIMSATADERKLSSYFFDCDTFHVMGRNFPVDIKYVPNVYAECSSVTGPNHRRGACASYVSDAIKMVYEIHRTEEDGAILVFLTSQMEVEWACENFQNCSAVVLPLHGKLSCVEQARVFKNYPGKRKVIFSTNLAETSLTIPGIKYVVDSGMVKECRFEPKNGMNMLRVSNISQSSAKQRAGRAGRTEPGKCYRLYSESDFESMPSHLEPEIQRVNLGIAVLRILSLGIKDVQDFEFVDAPCPEAINMAIRNLIQLDAVAYKNGVLELTDTGRSLVKLGTEPRLAKLILDSFHRGLGREGLVLAAVMANASSIFCRVGTDEEKLKSDCLKVPFCHRGGDLFTLLSVYMEWEAQPQESKNGWCWRNSINAKTMRRCKETVLELERCLETELDMIVPSYWLWTPHLPSSNDILLKKVILSSHTENIAVYSEYGRVGYEVALTGQHAKLHPSCSLQVHGQNPSWVIFGELLSISSLYLVCVTSIDYECLLTVQHSLPFDLSMLESRKMQVYVLTDAGSNLLKRFCGKMNSSLHCLVSSIRTDCMDSRIGIDVDFDKLEIRVFASSKDMKKVSSVVNDALERERKWLQDECTEKRLFRGRPESPPSVALFGSGAEIKHLEVDKRYLSVEISHPNANGLDDKELLMTVDQYASGFANFYKYGGIGQEGEDSEKWGKITFLSPESAEKATAMLNEVELHGSLLKVYPSRASFGGDQKMFMFPAIKAKVFWPRRRSRGVAIIKCATQDLDRVCDECNGMMIGEKVVRCALGKHMDCVILSGINEDISEPELADIIRNRTKRRIIDIFLLRAEAVNLPNTAACADALLREITSFMPNKNSAENNCMVQVFNHGPRDHAMKALVTFDGSLHLEAAKALQHIEGRVLAGFLPWQKIQCQQLFQSSVSCPAPIYFVIKKQLDSLLERFKHKKGVSFNLYKNENGSYRVTISSNATKTVAELRKPLEQLMKGKIITHPDLTPSVLQQLFSREGFVLMKILQRETDTYILHDKHNMNVKVFGPLDAVAMVEQKLVQSLLLLHENKQLEIRLRGGHLPNTLLKELVQRFGPDLHGLTEKVPGTEFVLDTRRHILCVRGSKELKQKVEKIIFEMAQSVSDTPADVSNGVVTCPICLCEIEDCYRLEGCGHEFCRMCLIEQCEATIKSHEGFPLCCVHEGCKSKILLVDLKCLLSTDKLEELFRASLGAFVASTGGTYRFCPSPDCPAVYKVVDPDSVVEQPPFACGACFVETCRKCHMEYHESISCEKYREFKDDPDTSLIEWRKGKENVKTCPGCSRTIEKLEGCNHIECKCQRHLCWVCLEAFETSENCYSHLRTVHESIV